MKNSRPLRPRRIEVTRWLMLCGLVGCGIAWGAVEFFALQRARYQARRDRQQPALPDQERGDGQAAQP
ncbi:MAG: hypothetical protein I8H87_07870 [Comamonadaceae bacterium]|jgi:hypothetical protein|nr:hypothetical protein [Comamonadaceae bacterium]